MYDVSTMAPIVLFTGENTYALRSERQAWLDEFRRRHGPENLSTLDAAGLLFRTLLDEASTAPFIARKRLLLVDGLPRFTKEEVLLLPTTLHEHCVLAFVVPNPDKRLAAWKELTRIATVKEYHPLQRRELVTWLTAEAQAMGCTLSQSARDLLIEHVGEDQELLLQEVRKLALFAQGRTLVPEDIELLVVPSGEQEIWHLMNLLTAEKRDEALRYAALLLSHGEDPFSLWNMLLWILRSLVSVVSSLRDAERNPAKIAALHKIPFPTARALLPFAQKVVPGSLRHFVHQTSDADIALKTGGYRATGEAPEEILALIDRLILGFGHLASQTPQR